MGTRHAGEQFAVSGCSRSRFVFAKQTVMFALEPRDPIVKDVTEGPRPRVDGALSWQRS